MNTNKENVYFNINDYVVLDSYFIVDADSDINLANKAKIKNKTEIIPDKETLIGISTPQNKSNSEENITLAKIYDLYSNDEIFSPFLAKIKDTKFSFSERLRKKIIDIILSLIGNSKIDFKSLRLFIFEGLPDEFPSVRSLLWKLMLNYLPGTVADWKEYLIDRRKDYDNITNDFIVGAGENNPNDSFLLSEIIKDVKRTRAHMHFFLSPSKGDDKETNADVITRILYIFAKLHPDIAYVQGMNEIIAPIFFSFSSDPNSFFNKFIEADVFYCFENFILEIKEIFLREKDETESGIHYRINKIEFLLEFYDKELYDHFKREKVELHYFMFRWYTLFFTQEFNMPDTLRLWDAIVVQNDKFEFVSYLCLAMINIHRKTLMNKDFSNIMLIMQNLNLLEIDMVSLIKKAVEIKNKLESLLQSF